METSSHDADLVIVNTCSVTATADQGARQTIRRIARENPAAKIVATGCYATRCADEVAALPGVYRKHDALRPEPAGGLVQQLGHFLGSVHAFEPRHRVEDVLNGGEPVRVEDQERVKIEPGQTFAMRCRRSVTSSRAIR